MDPGDAFSNTLIADDTTAVQFLDGCGESSRKITHPQQKRRYEGNADRGFEKSQIYILFRKAAPGVLAVQEVHGLASENTKPCVFLLVLLLLDILQ